VISPTFFTLAVIGYVCATGLALAYLVQRHDLIHRLGSVATLGGWVCHSLALVIRGVEMGRPPLASLPEAVSVAVWVVVLLEMWAERHYGVRVLGAFVLPVAVMLSMSAVGRPLEGPDIDRALSGAWLWASRPSSSTSLARSCICCRSGR